MPTRRPRLPRKDKPEMDRYLSLTEAASFASVSVRTLRKWIAAGALRVARTPGRKIRVLRSRLVALLEGGSAA